MEAKLKFKDFNKVLIIDDTNPSRAFLQLENYVKKFQNSRRYEMFWLDSDNDFIQFCDSEGFAIALFLNKTNITIYVHWVPGDGMDGQCSLCGIQSLQSLYHCLGCKNVLLCRACVKDHQSETGHFAIFENSTMYQIHPFLYRQIDLLMHKEADSKNIAQICSFFQKVVLKHGLSIVEAVGIDDSDLCESRTALVDIISYYNKSSQSTFTTEDNSSRKEEYDDENMDIDTALMRMLNMGFVNKDNCIRNLLERFKGNIPKTLDFMNRNINKN